MTIETTKSPRRKRFSRMKVAILSGTIGVMSALFPMYKAGEHLGRQEQQAVYQVLEQDRNKFMHQLDQRDLLEQNMVTTPRQRAIGSTNSSSDAPEQALEPVHTPERERDGGGSLILSEVFTGPGGYCICFGRGKDLKAIVFRCPTLTQTCNEQTIRKCEALYAGFRCAIPNYAEPVWKSMERLMKNE